MKPSVFLVSLADEAFNKVIKKIKAEIEEGIFWKKGSHIGLLRADKRIERQSEELKRLGASIKFVRGEYEWTEWIPPKGAGIYELISMYGTSSKCSIFYLLCLADGQEFFLKQTYHQIKLLKALPGTVARRLMARLTMEALDALRSELGKKIYQEH